MSVNEAIANLGSKIRVGEVEYDLPPLNYAQLGELGAWFETQLRLAHKSSRAFYSSDEWDRVARLINEDIAAKSYVYPQPGFFKQLLTAHGTAHAVWIALRDAGRLLDEQAVLEATHAKTIEFQTALMEANSDPTQGTGTGETQTT